MEPIVYPSSDGQRIAEHTLQFDWIVNLHDWMVFLFHRDPNIFVAADLLWYPVEGNPTIRTGPKVIVAFERPMGDRESYKQWDEGGIAPQVVFEVLPPSFRVNAILQKFQFYERHGVEELYIYNPDAGYLEGWRRTDHHLEEVVDLAGYTSPRLGVRFDPGDGPENLKVFGPDGEPFLTRRELRGLTKIDRLHTAIDRHCTQASRRQTAAIDRLAAEFAQLNEDYARLDVYDFQRAGELERRSKELRARLRQVAAGAV